MVNLSIFGRPEVLPEDPEALPEDPSGSLKVLPEDASGRPEVQNTIKGSE